MIRALRNPSLLLLVPGVILVGGVALSAFVYIQQKGTKEEGSSTDTGGAGQKSPIPGVNILPGVILTEPLMAFLPQFRKLLDFDVTVTSGFRSPASQARAMMHNYEAHGGLYGGGRAYLENLYGWGSQAADAIESGGEAGLTSLIQQRVDSGIETSGHLAGRGLDFRVSNLTSDQRAKLKAAGLELGVSVLDEGDHVHMDHIGTSTAAALATARGASKFARTTLPILLAAGAGVTMVGGVWWWVRRR